MNSQEHMIVVDCRGFSDPGQGRFHIGFNPVNMNAFFQHPDFHPWLAAVAENLAGAVRTGSRDIVFVVYCRNGGPQVAQRSQISVPLLA